MPLTFIDFLVRSPAFTNDPRELSCREAATREMNHSALSVPAPSVWAQGTIPAGVAGTNSSGSWLRGFNRRRPLHRLRVCRALAPPGLAALLALALRPSPSRGPGAGPAARETGLG